MQVKVQIHKPRAWAKYTTTFVQPFLGITCYHLSNTLWYSSTVSMAYVVEKRQSIERALEEGTPDGFLGDEEIGADAHLSHFIISEIC